MDRHATFTRRRFLAGASALATAACAPSATVNRQPVFAKYPFTLGIASGDPAPDGFVLWTRLAPEPLHGGGMPPEAIEVHYEIADDEAMRSLVQRGTAIATPALGHSVHAEVNGLSPGRWFFYRFRAGTEASMVGRTRTMPAAGATVDRCRFAFASCQHYSQGYFVAYRHMQRDDLDLVLHLGDYIYEIGSWAAHVRDDPREEPWTLEQYRNRHALYKSDPDLQAAHAGFPWVVTWDDHEVDNDYANDQSQDRDDPAIFLHRRAAAYQAYYEHMPLRLGALPRGAGMQLYRRLDFGDLVRFNVLDNRQYRTDQPCGEGRSGGGNLVVDCAARFDPRSTMLGQGQERWLLSNLASSRCAWNVLAQQMLMAQFKQSATGANAHWTDSWDGYAANRERILRFIAERNVANPIMLGGDIHSFWATDLKTDFNDERSPAVATEFVGTSVTSAGLNYDRIRAFLPHNPHIKFFDSRFRGYARCDVTRRQWRADFQALEHVRSRDAAASTLASFAVESGMPGARLA